MAWRRLEIVIEGANDLESVHLFQRLKAYHVVCICDDDGNRYYDEENKSPVDLNGRSNPKWGTHFEFNSIDIVEAQQKRLYLVVRLESHRNVSCLGGKFIGQVRVRLEELLNDFGDADDKKLVTRSVINKNVEAQGRLTFSYKFGRTLDHPPAAPPPQPDNGNPVAQIPQRRNSNGHPIVRGAVEGVTTGLVTTLADILLNDN